jgi:hypothetical protein
MPARAEPALLAAFVIHHVGLRLFYDAADRGAMALIASTLHEILALKVDHG